MNQSIDLSTLKKTTEQKPPRIVIYGAGGIGKSTFAADAPNPVFLDIENGLDGIECAKIKIPSWEVLGSAMLALQGQDHEFKTVVIDSIDWLEQLIHKHVAELHGVKSVTDISYGRGYGESLVYIERLLNGLTRLRDEKGMTIILIAHDQIKRYDDPMGDGYDRHQLKLHEKAGAKVFEWADAVLFAKTKTLTKSSQEGFKKSVKAIDAGRVIYTNDSPAFMAKHRASLALPDEIPLSWEAFISNVGQR